MFIQTEATPNPATLKFIPGRTVLDSGTMEFTSRDAAARSPLAEKLFGVPGVTGVFYGSDFVTVTKDDSDWQHLKPAILGAIMEHYMSGAPLLADGSVANDEAADEDDEFFDEADAETVATDQGPDRNAGASGGRQRRRRHHVPRLQGRHRLSQHEGLLLRLPVIDRDACSTASRTC